MSGPCRTQEDALDIRTLAQALGLHTSTDALEVVLGGVPSSPFHLGGEMTGATAL